jgi:hypothetical protein
MNRLARSLFATAAALALAGCASLPLPHRHELHESVYAPENFTAVTVLPADVRRVVLLPLDRDGHATPEISRELDGIRIASLQQRGRFEVVHLTRAECRRMFGEESFNSAEELPHGFAERVAREFAADAVLLIDLTAHRAHRPLMLGLRAKLATADGVRLLWVFDEIFDASSPAVATAATEHFHDPKAPVQGGEAALRSPGRFATFATTAMFATIPQR